MRGYCRLIRRLDETDQNLLVKPGANGVEQGIGRTGTVEIGMYALGFAGFQQRSHGLDDDLVSMGIEGLRAGGLADAALITAR
jgi:hypothetical protein